MSGEREDVHNFAYLWPLPQGEERTPEDAQDAVTAWRTKALQAGYLPLGNVTLSLAGPSGTLNVTGEPENILVEGETLRLLTVPDHGDAALREMFTYHPPRGPEDVARYEAIRDAGHHFALVIARLAPAGPDRTTAIRAAREAVMWANAAIATAPKDRP